MCLPFKDAEALLCVQTRLSMLRVAVAALHDSKTAAGVGR